MAGPDSSAVATTVVAGSILRAGRGQELKWEEGKSLEETVLEGQGRGSVARVGASAKTSALGGVLPWCFSWGGDLRWQECARLDGGGVQELQCK